MTERTKFVRDGVGITEKKELSDHTRSWGRNQWSCALNATKERLLQ